MTPGTDYKGRPCRDCHGTGSVYDPNPHDYTPGAMVRRPCSCNTPPLDAVWRPFTEAPRPFADDLMDAALISAGITPADYWAKQAEEFML